MKNNLLNTTGIRALIFAGKPKPAPLKLGIEEGETCNRDGCQGRIEYLPDESAGCCSCHINPPCSYCTSTKPECPICGWRQEEE